MAGRAAEQTGEAEAVAAHLGRGLPEPVPQVRESLQAIFERSTQSLSGGGGPRGLPRRTVTFTVDHSVCAPGVFAEDFELTLGALTPELELEAVNKSDSSGSLGFAMAQRSLLAFNGQPLGAGHDEWLWRALDQGGRQLVVLMFSEVGTVGAPIVGKAKASIKLGTL